MSEDRQPLQRPNPLGVVDLRAVNRAAEDLDRPIVGGAIDREGNAILAAVREGEARRIAECRGRAVHELRGKCQRAQRT